MNERIKEILSWYGSDNPGTRTNLARLLSHGKLGGTGRLVILPVDQGFEHGPARSFAPNPPGYDPSTDRPAASPPTPPATIPTTISSWPSRRGAMPTRRRSDF